MTTHYVLKNKALAGSRTCTSFSLYADLALGSARPCCKHARRIAFSVHAHYLEITSSLNAPSIVYVNESQFDFGIFAALYLRDSNFSYIGPAENEMFLMEEWTPSRRFFMKTD